MDYDVLCHFDIEKQWDEILIVWHDIHKYDANT